MHKFPAILASLFKKNPASALVAAVFLPASLICAQPSAGATVRGTIAEDDLRVETVGYRLSVANADRCDAPQMLTGLLIHNLGDYDEKSRARIALKYNLTYGFGILAVVPASAAEAAGLHVGDQIIAVSGQDLRPFADDKIQMRASFDRTGDFEEFLSESLKKTPVLLTIQRDGKVFDIAIRGQLGCGGRVTLDLGSDINAWSDGTNVAVTRSLVDSTANNDELAFVVAHEMSHNILHHNDQTSTMKNLIAQFGVGAGHIKKNEIAADINAVGMLTRANYDPTASKRFLQRSWLAHILDLPITHPGISARIATVSDVIQRQGTVIADIK